MELELVTATGSRKKQLEYVRRCPRAISRAMADVSNGEPSNVLVIDDYDLAREWMQFLLGVAGYTSTAFGTAAEFPKSEIRHLACLILDHHMAYITGLHLS